MENKEKLYIVSFGDSDKFRMRFADSKAALKKSQRLVDIEKELEDYVKEKLPMAKANYYTTPVIVEVDPADGDMYSSYPILDGDAVSRLKEKVLTEVENMEYTRSISSDAPWSDIN